MIITDRRTLDILLTGTTHYIATGPETEAAIYYGTGRAHMRGPNGKRMTGVWRLNATGYEVDWQDGPSASWQIDVEPGRIAYRDMDGIERGTVNRIVPGDAAGMVA